MMKNFLLLNLITLSYLLSAQNPYQLQNLGKEVNSEYDEIVPYITADGSRIYFVRVNHPKNTYGKKESEDIWYSDAKPDGSWTAAKRLDKPFNTDRYNGLYGISPDGNTFIIRGCYENGVKKSRGYSYIRKTANGWTKPECLKIEMYDEYDLGNLSGAMLANDGKTLLMYFSRTYNSNKTDIFVSFLNEDSTWTRPFNLGPQVNTAATESTPFLASDGKTLYFGSDRNGGYGGSDIYVTKRLDDTWQNWSTPRNMSIPINSPGWEAYYSIDAKGEYAYLVTSKGGFGLGDICKVKIIEDYQPEPSVIICGKVLNAKTMQPVAASLQYEVLKTGIEAGRAMANPITGEYKIVLPIGKNYGFSAKAKGYIAISDGIDLSNIFKHTEIKRDLFLVPLEVGQTVRLNNLFFEFSKSTITTESYPELNRLQKLLTENEEMKIEIAGHTDNIGSDEANMKLSQQRADAVKQYLVDKGIAAERITAKGYGESKPIKTNDTEEGRQFNRRVEFTILSY